MLILPKEHVRLTERLKDADLRFTSGFQNNTKLAYESVGSRVIIFCRLFD